MDYADRYREESASFRADLQILTGEKIEARCRTLSLLLTAAVRSGEITPTEIDATRRRAPASSAAAAAPI
jgi:hypothetical protein